MELQTILNRDVYKRQTWYKSDDDLPDMNDYDIIKGKRTYQYFDREVDSSEMKSFHVAFLSSIMKPLDLSLIHI